MTRRISRVGLFPYLNVQPLVFGLRSVQNVEIVMDLPSRISDRFRRGDLDAAMVPSFEAATLDAPILDSVCIGSDGAVETVILHHRVSLETVRTVALDEASRTSAALTRILIAEASGSMPRFVTIPAAAAATVDTDAVLVIGDPAFSFARPGFQALDLGAFWQRSQSLPFVFAVMALGPRAIEWDFPATVGGALKLGLDNASTIAGSYNSGVDPDRALHYLRHALRYNFGDREKEGLARFYRLAGARGLLVGTKELRFHAA